MSDSIISNFISTCIIVHVQGILQFIPQRAYNLLHRVLRFTETTPSTRVSYQRAWFKIDPVLMSEAIDLNSCDGSYAAAGTLCKKDRIWSARLCRDSMVKLEVKLHTKSI